jgi:outer membrane protein
MRIKTGVCSAVFLIFILLSASIAAAADLKIGVFDFQEILTQSRAGAIAFDKLQEEGETRKKKLEKKASEFKRLKQESAIVSGEKYQNIMGQLRELKDDIENDQRQYGREMQTMEFELLKPVRAAIIDLIKAMGEKEHYTLILEIRESGCLYFEKTINLTKTIIQRYNAQYGKTTGRNE